MCTYLVLGASSVSGQAILRAIHMYHKKKTKDYHIIATSSRNVKVPLAHETIGGIEFSHKDASTSLLKKLSIQVDYFISTLARGKVGLPFDRVSDQEIEEAYFFSTYPVIYLTDRLRPEMTLALSGFVWTPTFLQIYGAMLYAKFRLEEFIFKNPGKAKLLRLGYFRTNSSRAIELLAQKSFQKGLYSDYELYQFQTQSLAREKLEAFSRHLRAEIRSEESVYLSRSTGEAYAQLDSPIIVDAAYRALYGEKAKSVVNLAGQTIWEDNQKGEWPLTLYKRDLA